MRLERTRQELRKILKYQIHKNQFCETRVVQWGPTDRQIWQNTCKNHCTFKG